MFNANAVILIKHSFDQWFNVSDDQFEECDFSLFK